MATERHYLCNECNTKQWIDSLFDALYSFSNKKIQRCNSCNKDMEFQLIFNFGLGAGRFPSKVLAAYLPEEIRKWPNDNTMIEFYPFLVITKSIKEGNTSAWLPYWHIVKKNDQVIERKYGQWAPFIDTECYNSLLLKAKKQGFLEI